MICGKTTLERFQRDPKSLVGKWLIWYQVRSRLFSTPSGVHESAYCVQSVWEIRQVNRNQVRLITTIPERGTYPCEKWVPLSPLLDPETPFFKHFSYLGPRKWFTWIKEGAIVKLKRPIRFYAQIIDVGSTVYVEYRPPVAPMNSGSPEIIDRDNLQNPLPQYPFLRNNQGSQSSCSIKEFRKRWQVVNDPYAVRLWADEHARRLRNEERWNLKRLEKAQERLQEQQASTPSPSPEKRVRGPSLWERIRTQAPPSDEDED